MLALVSLSLKEAYDNNFMVNLPELFNRSIRCRDMVSIFDVSVMKYGSEEKWKVKFLMKSDTVSSGNAFYSNVTDDKNEAINVMNELLEMINVIDLIRTAKNCKVIHFDFKLADQTDYLMKNKPVV